MLKALASTIALLTFGLSVDSAAAGTLHAKAVLQADKPGAEISRNLQGQFSEHLGGGIYDGVWVGEDSPIPNVRGIRSDVVEALNSIKKAIQEVSEYVTSTAAAVEEQSTVTSEMSNGMQQAAAEAASIGMAA